MKKIILSLIAIFILNLLSAATCEEIYFFILNSQWSFTEPDLESFNITENEIYNYGIICSDSKYPSLPEKRVPEITIYRENKYCDYSKNILFRDSIPIYFDIKLENASCSKINKLKYFFQIDEHEGEYLINGIPVVVAVFLIFSLVVLLIRKSNSWINKAGKEEENFR